MRIRESDPVETQTHRIIAKLVREGWVKVGADGATSLSALIGPGEVIVVPRHREISSGVAREIAKSAGWLA